MKFADNFINGLKSKSKKELIDEIQKLKKGFENHDSILKIDLNESAELSRLIVENSHDGIMIISDNYQIEYANNRLSELTNFELKDLINKDFRELINSNVKSSAIERYNSRLNGNMLNPTFELPLITKNEELKIFEIRSTIFKDSKGNVKTLSQFKDITQRKRTEEAIRQSEEKFRSIVENSHLGIVIIDMNYKFEYVNYQFCKILHTTKEKLINTDFRKIISKESLEIVSNRYKKRQQGIEVPSEYEIHLIRSDGEIRITKLSSTVINFAGNIKTIAQILDVTENVKKEKLQNTLFKISQAVNEVTNLPEFLGLVRNELSAIIDTTNFYVALYDAQSETYTFPYHVDEYDTIDDFTQMDLKDSLTDYVRRTNQVLLVNSKVQKELEDRGDIKRIIGENCPIWIGTTLVVDNVVVGIMALQNYHNPEAYNLNDLELLKIVSENVSSAIWKKQIIDKLRESELRYRDFISRTSEGIYRIDFEPPIDITLSSKEQVNQIYKFGIIGECNNSSAKMYGFASYKDLVGKNLNVFYGNKISDSGFQTQLEFVKNNYKLNDVETVGINQKGKKLNILNNAIGIIKDRHLHNIWGIQKDITESKRLQTALKQIAEGISSTIGDSFFKSMLEFIGDTLKVNFAFIAKLSDDKKTAESLAFWEKDGLNKNFVYSLLHSPSNEVIKSNKTWLAENIREQFPNDEFLINLEIYSYLGKALLNSNGEPIGLLVVLDQNKFENIEFSKSVLEIFASRSSAELERLKYVEELVKAKELAERSDILKSEFIAQMSHEIRTPVNTILSFTSLIKESLEDKLDEDLKDSFKMINNGGRRLIRTIDLILNVSQIQSGNLVITPINLNITHLLKDLISEFTQEAKKRNITINLESKNENLLIKGDSYSTTQIFANLIHNALKYTLKGNVNIKVEETEKNVVLVKVIDSGVGMNTNFLNRIFDPFSQEETGYTRKFEGTGLGLTLVKKYCELNNASISVESVKNQGSTFIVQFEKVN